LDVQGLPYVINVTLPDNPSDFIHRIGRVGRADRMGLAISIIATDEEKVWYHKCKSKGSNCSNTNLLEQGGCCIWYNEKALLSQIQLVSDEMQTLNGDFTFPGGGGAKYGKKRSEDETVKVLEGHGDFIRKALSDLNRLEVDSQIHFFSYGITFNEKSKKN
jgi:ATP-dependent RNA helicase DDX1